jgi:hypothetical protein
MTHRWSSLKGLIGCLLLGGLAAAATSACGLADTATTAAAGGVSEAQQAQQARATEDRVKQQLDAAAQADAQRRAAAEKETE